MVEYSSLSEEERIYIENCFILDLNKEENLNKCIEVIDNFLLNYKEDFLENLKYKPVVEILLKRISESNEISKKRWSFHCHFQFYFSRLYLSDPACFY